MATTTTISSSHRRSAVLSQTSWRERQRPASPPPCTRACDPIAYRVRLDMNTCEEGMFVYLPSKEDIPATSCIHDQNRGGKPFDHPAVVIGVDKVKRTVDIMIATSNNKTPILDWAPNTDDTDLKRRQTHVLIEPKDDRNKSRIYDNPDQMMSSLKLRDDSEDVRYVCYVRIGHVFTIEPENLVKFDRHLILTPESVRRLQGKPSVVLPKPRENHLISTPPSKTDNADAKGSIKRIVLAPRGMAFEGAFTWLSTAKSVAKPATPSLPMCRWQQTSTWRRAGVVAVI